MKSCVLKGYHIRKVRNHCNPTNHPSPLGYEREERRQETGPQHRKEEADDT